MARKRILLVDDSATALMMEKMLLRQGDYELLSAGDGEQAVEVARSEHPDLILMDFVMPRMNGVQAVAKIRALDDTRLIPIIMVTTRGEPENVTAAFEAGCNDYVSKPINGPELISKIRSCLGA